jgi:hypothetical protein
MLCLAIHRHMHSIATRVLLGCALQVTNLMWSLALLGELDEEVWGALHARLRTLVADVKELPDEALTQVFQVSHTGSPLNQPACKPQQSVEFTADSGRGCRHEQCRDA